MVIYGEILFLENAVAGAMILWATMRLTNMRLSVSKFVIGSILCGLYSFTIFQVQNHWMLSLLEKLIFSMILIRFCFGKKRYGLRLFVFYGISFCLGGITMGLYGLCSLPAVSSNGSVYLEQMTFLHLISGGSAAALSFHLLLALIREHRFELRTKRHVTILHQGKEFHIRGFLDTGNRLVDPETGLPVCLICPELWKTVVGEDVPLRWIAYRGAAGFEGVLAVMEPDGIQIGEKEKQRRCKAVLGTNLNGWETENWEGCQLLLNGYFSDECMEYGGRFCG